MTDEDIISAVTAVDGQSEEESDVEEEKITHSAAITAFNTATAWCESQNECTSDRTLLKSQRDMALNKRQSGLVQKKICDFFK
jgi:hypothetical protein